ncbi:trypsin-like peptidase domain-containing protein, partial [Bacteroidota bacterium]
DYKNIFKYLSVDIKGFGDSGNCNININCDNDDLWQLLKHSVCKITYNGWLCSGALINNTKQDGYPYLLTANHCINSPYDASSAVFYFNYESLDCTNTDGRKDQTISSSTIVATPPQKTLDFSLLELSTNPPPEYHPYFAGWNRDVLDPQEVTSIHHPRGDIKKITKSYDGATTGDYGEGYNEYAHWWIDEWDEGTTEGGSSGSPLFDKDGRIIGDLTGGDASCSYNYNDYYQQFYHSWKDFSDSTDQLKPWLDPNNSETVSLLGYLPYDSMPSNLKASFNDTVVNLNWNHVIDTASIKFYYIYRNSVKIDSIKYANYQDTVAYKNTLYEYFITAKYLIPGEFESLPSNSIFMRSMNSLLLPFAETFEDGYIPDYWYEERSNDTVGWEYKSGGYSVVLDTAFEGSLNAYYYNENSETSKLVLPKFDLSSYTNVKLSFYMHMQAISNNVHNLKVLYKNTDSLDWTVLRSYDTSIDIWEKKEVPLPDLTKSYQIAIEGIGLGGFGICIDSLAIIEDGKFIDPDFNVNVDTICVYDSIEFSTTVSITNDIFWNFGNTAIPQIASGVGPHWVKYDSPGIKPVQLIVNDTYIKNDYDVAVVYNMPGVPSLTNIGNELISSSEVGNQWYFNGIPIEGATKNTFIIEEDGNYYVEVTNSFKCTSVSESKYMVVSDIETEEKIKDIQNEIIVYPNPNNGNFTLEIGSTLVEDQLKYKIIDITGKVIQYDVIEKGKEIQQIEILNSIEGIYIIQIITNNNFYTTKIIIKK